MTRQRTRSRVTQQKTSKVNGYSSTPVLQRPKSCCFLVDYLWCSRVLTLPANLPSQTRRHAACALTGRQGKGVVFFPAEKISTPVRWAPVGRPRPPLTALVHGLSLSCRRTQPASAVGPSSLQYSPWTRTGGKRLWIMTFALLGGGLARPPSPPASLKTQPGTLPYP